VLAADGGEAQALEVVLDEQVLGHAVTSGEAVRTAGDRGPGRRGMGTRWPTAAARAGRWACSTGTL
jgi:hypothetical protein